MAYRKPKLKKLTNKGIDIGSIQDMFGQMTGANEAEIDIILPKYVSMRNLLIRFCKIYKVLINYTIFIETFPEYEENIKEIDDFINGTIEQLELGTGDEDESKYYDKTQTEMNELYRNLKANENVKKIVKTCATLLKYKKYISNRERLEDAFIKREPGLFLYLLQFSALDFKSLWYSPKITKTIKKFFLTILNYTFDIGYKLYEIITSPDIDIEKFSSTIIASIDHLRTQIPRCDKAFDIIANSVKLLENNFNTYYKSSVESENPDLILENFVIDVSMKQDINLSTKNQFKRIIIYMKQIAERNQSHRNNPNIKKIFKVLNYQFRMMEAEAESKETEAETKEEDELEEEYAKIVDAEVESE